MSNARPPARLGLDQFPRVLCGRWSHKNLALLGDASASAHFSIGSGTKLALERRRARRLPPFRARPRRGVREIRKRARTRGAAPAVGCAQLAGMVRGGRALSRPRPGAVQLLAADPLAAHQPREPAPARSRLAGRRRSVVPAPRRQHRQPAARADVRAVPAARPRSFANRVVVSPMAQYKAVDGCPTDWHFAHYAERARAARAWSISR